MEEVLYKQLFMYLKQMLHHPHFRPILIDEDNQILNFLNLALEESWRVWREKQLKEMDK